MFKLALIQMRVDPGAPEVNLDRASMWIQAAAAQGAQIALLPEAMPVGWTDARTHELSERIPNGEACQRLGRLAREHRVSICSGLIERAHDGRVFNAAVLIGPDGEVLLHHRKIYELEIAHALYATGDRLSVVETPLGRVGVMICADGFAPGQSISRALALMGADFILSPCAWAVPAGYDNEKTPYGRLWTDNYAPVARDFRIWIAGVSNVGPIASGPWAGRQCIGASLVIDPQGNKAAQLPFGENAESLHLIEIEPAPRPARGTSWETHRANRKHLSSDRQD